MKKKNTLWLHNHAGDEAFLGLGKDHVIVDREDWEQALSYRKIIEEIEEIMEEKLKKV